jgi:hypothetical protein
VEGWIKHNVNSSMIYLICYKNIYKCHNVYTPRKREKLKIKLKTFFDSDFLFFTIVSVCYFVDTEFRISQVVYLFFIFPNFLH